MTFNDDHQYLPRQLKALSVFGQGTLTKGHHSHVHTYTRKSISAPQVKNHCSPSAQKNEQRNSRRIRQIGLPVIETVSLAKWKRSAHFQRSNSWLSAAGRPGRACRRYTNNEPRMQRPSRSKYLAGQPHAAPAARARSFAPTEREKERVSERELYTHTGSGHSGAACKTVIKSMVTPLVNSFAYGDYVFTHNPKTQYRPATYTSPSLSLYICTPTHIWAHGGYAK